MPALLCCVALVLAGDVDPPPGPVGDSGPTLNDVLLAAGGGVGESVVMRSFSTPANELFETVATEDGVLERIILTNLTGSLLTVHVRDAAGLRTQVTQLAMSPTQSLEMGFAYTAPLEAAFVGSAGSVNVTFVTRTD